MCAGWHALSNTFADVMIGSNCYFVIETLFSETRRNPLFRSCRAAGSLSALRPVPPPVLRCWVSASLAAREIYRTTPQPHSSLGSLKEDPVKVDPPITEERTRALIPRVIDRKL